MATDETAVTNPEPNMSDLCGRHVDDSELFRSVLSRIGDKWSVMLVGMLLEGPLRFTELKRTTPGISGRMLTHTLRQLERDGLVEREVFAEIPPRVVYRSTPLGKSLAIPVMAVAEWASAHQDEIIANRDRYDEAADS